MEKGIVHMLEAILVSLTFLIIVPFLLYPTLTRTDWNYVQMSLNGQDLLATLDKIYDSSGTPVESFLQNIMNRNSSDLENEITENFTWLENKKMNYGIETLGVIRNEIRVGFNCTGAGCTGGDVEEEIMYLEKILRPAYINGRYVYFRVFPISYDNIGRHKMDVLLIRGVNQRDYVQNLIDSGDDVIDDLKVHLNRGTGIIGFYNITPGDVDELEKDFFGLEIGASSGDGDLTFLNINNASKPNYAIQKYFYAVGMNENFTYKWDEHEETEVTLWGNPYKVRRNDTDLPPDGIFEALDLDTDGDGSYDLFGKEENYDFSITSPPEAGSQVHDFVIEKIDPRGRFFIMNFNKANQYIFHEDLIKTSGPQNNPPVKSDKDESYDVLKDAGGKSALVVNGTDNTKWRTVWVSGGEGDDIYALVKSSIIWASDRSWWNVMRSISGEYTKISYFVS
ncbi:MAG: hypothetical protein KAT37_01655, partial [Candidatus Aenigmarchaeota archaeon]|nr:hypothetical protein [Candidatus Aenigmarchaeota archaeon]